MLKVFDGFVQKGVSLTTWHNREVGYRVDTLAVKPGSTKFIYLKPITTTESSVLTSSTDLECTESPGGRQHGKEDPSQQCREGGGIRWLSTKPSYLYAPPYWWNGWGETERVAWSSPLLGSSWRSSHSVNSWHGPQTITRGYICLSRVYSIGLWHCKPQQLCPHWWAWQPQGNLKAESLHHSKHPHTA